MDRAGTAFRGDTVAPPGSAAAAPEPGHWPAWRTSLRGRLVLMSVFSILPMLLLFAAEGYVAYRAERARAGQRQLEVARSMAATVDRELGGVIESLRALALSPRLQVDDMPGFRALAIRFIATQPAGSSLALLARSGHQLVNTLVPPGGVLPQRKPAANVELTIPVFDTAEPMISNLFSRALDGTMIVTAEVPVLRDRTVAYDLSLVLPAQRFTQIIAAQHLEPGTIAAVYDRKGIRVARLPLAPRFIGEAARPELRQALLAANEGVVSSSSIEGIPVLTAFSHAAMSGWSVTNSVPEALLRHRLRASLTMLLGTGLLGLAASLGLATVLARRVLLPMHALARLAADPSAPDEPVRFSLREVDETASALRHSLAGRQAALEALQHLNESLEARVRHEIRNREQAQARLAQSQRMEALGQLAGGIAHDFNNVLQAVTGGLSLIQRRADDPAAVRRLAEMANNAAGRGAAITGRLLTFARRGELTAVAIAPSPLLEGLREMLTPTLGANITVGVAASPALPRLAADRAQLETVLVNLAVNARDAMPAGGTLSLSATIDQPPSLPPGDYIRLALADTGDGMEAAVLARASEPFFTTKGPGQGTGLGLAMARGFAEQSGGALAIRSRPGSGTIVSLWFPQAAAGADTPEQPVPAEVESVLPAMHVLMVDDDAMVREVLAQELEDRGFKVTTASDGLSALSLLDRGESVDVLISDHAMPGMDGRTLIGEARRRRPGLPVLLLTGYAEADAGLVAVQDRLTLLLRKPVSGQDLVSRLAGLHHGPAAPE